MGRPARAALLLAALLFTLSCSSDGIPVQLSGARVLYAGEPYGDFLVLAQQVRACLKSDKPGLPRLMLVDQLFECYTRDGWRWALGCEGAGTIVVVAPVVVESHGGLWSHELAHYYGVQPEGSVCGALELESFSIDLADAGP